MAAPRLELNFFPVRLPEPFPFRYRDLAEGESLNDHERSWQRVPGERRALLVITSAPAHPTYVVESFPSTAVPPGVVQRIAASSLAEQFSKNGYRVEPNVVGFDVFRDRDVSDAMPYLHFAKGLEFRADSLVDRARQRTMGFFVSMRVQRTFAPTTSRSDLLNSARGQVVRLTTGMHQGQWRLTASDEAKAEAVVQQEGRTERVPLANVVVPASATILREFGRIVGKLSLAGDAVKHEQQLSFRHTKGTRLNPNWLANQYDFVKMWLVEASQHGRIDFPWHSSTLSMDIRPVQLDAERPQ